MNLRTRVLLFLFAAVLAPVANAQDTSDDEANVLLIIERVWDADQKGDQDHVDELLTNNFMGWAKNSPAPRSKNSTSAWARFGEQMGRMERYELYPLSITVEGDVAVAHYLYSVAYKPKGGDIELSNGRYTDILVRTDDGWKFIAWHGGDD
ncbi:MAG: nuclear transport factor 2 family protein [Woeseiaceae bacterium]|nr:nuclear transport factor 2 family protein [Woeseiaceae bacterium]